MELESAISELINLKAKIDQENSDLIEQRERLRAELSETKLEKETYRGSRGELQLNYLQARIANSALLSRAECLREYIGCHGRLLDDVRKEIGDQIGLCQFDTRIKELRQSLESTITTYGEDSLQFELLKRTTANREMRVELTRVANELEAKKKDIERREKEREAIRLAELQRSKEEEDRKAQLEEERATAERTKQSGVFLKERLAASNESKPAQKPTWPIKGLPTFSQFLTNPF